MIYISKGLPNEDRAELIQYCEESAQYYNEFLNVPFSLLTDEVLLDYTEYFEKKV